MKTSFLTNYLGSLGVGFTALVSTASANDNDAGVLYTMDNASAGNHVMVITRSGGAAPPDYNRIWVDNRGRFAAPGVLLPA